MRLAVFVEISRELFAWTPCVAPDILCGAIQSFTQRSATMFERIVRFPEVRMLSGLSRSTIYLRISEGLFPRPISLGPRMVGWRESEIAALNAARVRGESEDAIRALLVRLEHDRRDVA